MAITLVGSDFVTRAAASATDMELTLPAHATDDVGIVFAQSDTNQASFPTLSLITATGWTELTNSPWNDDTGTRDRVVAGWYKVFTSSSETNPVISESYADQRSCMVYVFRGVDTTTPLDGATPTHNQGAATLNPDPPDITTNTDNAAVILYLNETSSGVTAFVAPSGYTLGENQVGVLHTQSAGAYDLDVGGSGTISPAAWSNTGTGGDYSQITVALRDASASTDTTIAVPTGPWR